ncbi:MAG: hypothetical protein R3B96_02275 [Pirellulaceae bacterium]
MFNGGITEPAAKATNKPAWRNQAIERFGMEIAPVRCVVSALGGALKDKPIQRFEVPANTE